MPRFFIDRPIFAWVLAIIVMLAGLLSLSVLPVSQYPEIAPPEISVRSFYPGASASTVENSVTQVIEQQMKGIDNLSYMYSTSDSYGQSAINLVFAQGTNPDIAQVQVQNKLQLALPMLPDIVQRQGVQVGKSSRNFLLVVAFVTEDGSMISSDLNDYVVTNVLDPISRVPGVGEVMIFGSQYAMRIWCDPTKFEQYKLTVSDVIAAIRAQNMQVPGGQLGGMPAVPGQQINVTVSAASRLQTVEQFENIMLRVNPDGSTVFLRDVARMELDGENLNFAARYRGMLSSGMAVRLATGANALHTADAVKAEVERLAQFFPPGMKAVYTYDTSPFVRISIIEVYRTLFEAIFLVFLVMFLFLQNLRATIIPTIAIPVVLLGTFAVLNAFGYSINTLTMFAMIIAIGLLVDDAIVVVENTERVMHEDGLPPREATRKSMDQVTGALVGIGVVLSAVFVPMAFFPGSVGVIYRQFSVTIVTAMALSVLVAVILTPALCATMLKPKNSNKPQTGIFARFNRWFERLTAKYQGAVHRMVRRPAPYLLVYAGALALMAFLFLRLPTAFLPDEDQGMMLIQVQLPAAASLERTVEVLQKVEDYFLTHETDTVDTLITVAGFSFSGMGQNAAMGFLRLKDWNERKRAEHKIPAIQQRAMRHFSTIKEGMVFAFAPPAIVELGQATGFSFILVDQGNMGHDALMQARNELLGKARQNPNLRNVRANGLDNVEQYNLDIDLAKAKALGVPINELYTTISAFWASTYVDDFMDKGRPKKVILQADAPFRMQAGDFNRYHVRNALGEMVPFSAFMTGHFTYGSPRLERFDGLPSIEILGEAAPGRSSGEAMAIMESLAAELPPGFGVAWSGISYEERMAGDQALLLYALSLLVVFLCLAALYESWSIPFSVMLIAPFGVIGALGGATLRGMNNDVYFQVGLLATVGLSAKNAILIVEFAKALERAGRGVVEAMLEAVRMRLRPIIMTSMAFFFGVLPLALSTGAGSGAQNAVGTAITCGTLAATFFCLYYTPIFFVLIRSVFRAKFEQKAETG